MTTHIDDIKKKFKVGELYSCGEQSYLMTVGLDGTPCAYSQEEAGNLRWVDVYKPHLLVKMVYQERKQFDYMMLYCLGVDEHDRPCEFIMNSYWTYATDAKRVS